MKVHEFKHEMRTTSAVFGRKYGINIVFKGDQAATDGKTIYLPAMDDNATLTDEQVKVMRGYVDHEAGHLRHTDMPLVLDKYDRWTNSGKEELRDLHNVLEDIWMERRVMDEYAGSEKNLRQVSKSACQKDLDKLKQKPELLPKVKKGLSRLTHHSAQKTLFHLGRKDWGGVENSQIIDELLDDKMKAHAESWLKALDKAENTSDVVDIAKSVYKMIQEEPPEGESEGESQLDGDPEDFDPESGQDVEDGEPSGKQEAQEGEGEQDLSALVDEVMEGSAEDGEEGDVPSKGTNNGTYVGPYTVYTDEYDKHYTTSNWPEKFDVGTFEQIVSETSGVVSVMKAKLRRALLAKLQRDWDFGKESGRLDSKRLVSAYTGSPSVYKTRSDREEEDTAVTFLVDLSGSMYGSKIRVAQQSVIAFARCLEGTQIKYNIVGFDANYIPDYPSGEYSRKDGISSYEFKGFDEPLRVAKGKLGSLTEVGGCNNADRCSIQRELNVLKARGESKKVLIVLSDGSPCHSSSSNTSELCRQAKFVLDQSKKDGIQSVGIGLLDSTVKRIYDDHVVVNKVEDLSGVLFQKLTKILVG